MPSVNSAGAAPFEVVHASAIGDQLWDAFVMAHPASALPHLRAMCALQASWKTMGEHSLVALNAQREIVAVLPLFLVERRVLRFVRERSLDSSTISGNGPIIASSLSATNRQLVLSMLEQRVRTLARSLGAVRSGVVYPVFAGTVSTLAAERYHPLRPFGWRECLQPTLVADLSLSEAELFANCRSSTRSIIRQATRVGATCRPVRDRAEWLGFYEANLWTQGEGALSRHSLEHIWDALILPGHAFAVCVEHENAPVCAVVVTVVNNVALYFLAFNSPQSHAIGANRLALWEAIRESRSRGARWFEIGPLHWGTGKEAAISDFKRGFGGRVWYQTSATIELTPLRTAALNLAVRLYQTLSGVSRKTRTPHTVDAAER